MRILKQCRPFAAILPLKLLKVMLVVPRRNLSLRIYRQLQRVLLLKIRDFCWNKVSGVLNCCGDSKLGIRCIRKYESAHQTK